MAYTVPPEGTLLPPKPNLQFPNPPAWGSTDDYMAYLQATMQDRAWRKNITKTDDYTNAWVSWYNYQYLTGTDNGLANMPHPTEESWAVSVYNPPQTEGNSWQMFDLADKPGTQVCPPIAFKPIPSPQH
jgi:hypothetical protein